MRHLLTLAFISWCVLLGVLLGWATVHAQALPAPECLDILTLEAETAMEQGWVQDSKIPIETGGMAFLWTKGESARLLYFAPEGQFKVQKGTVLLRAGRCEDHGAEYEVFMALLDGEHI